MKSFFINNLKHNKKKSINNVYKECLVYSYF